MTKLKAHFDGKVLVPDEPVNLPLNCALEVRVQPLKGMSSQEKPLVKLLHALEELPENSTWPSDGAQQHDHYLYGLPKRS
ncbi:MAG: hypothetical protein HY298_13620 [Verrucomicrobia bacterium]|nr:hypothetical protein [Verrucomicrobiota bacterium]